MSNPWSRFRALSGAEALWIGTVIAHLSDGRSLVELPGGARMIASGQEVAEGQRAFVRGGKIDGPAPGLSAVEIEV